MEIPRPSQPAQEHGWDCYHCQPWNCPSSDTITAMETQWFCTRKMKPGAGKATVRDQVPIPEFPFQKQHVPLAQLPALQSLLCSVLWPQKSQSVPLKHVQKLRKVLLSLVLFLTFTLGHFPFRQQKRQEDSPWLMESAADNTLHLKFLLIFCLDTL